MLTINEEKVVDITDSRGHIYYDSDEPNLGLSEYGFPLPDGTITTWYCHRPNSSTLELINPAHVASIRLLSLLPRMKGTPQ